MDIQGLLLRWTMVSLSAGDGNWIISYPMSSGAKLKSWRVTPALGLATRSHTRWLPGWVGFHRTPGTQGEDFLSSYRFCHVSCAPTAASGFQGQKTTTKHQNSAHRSHRSLVLELEQESVASHRTVHWTDYWYPMVKWLVKAKNRGCNPITNHFGIFLLVHRNPQNGWKMELY